MSKLWARADEWIGYASCHDDDRFISETNEFDSELRIICQGCRVRPECAKWAVSDKASAVFVVGVRLPDPGRKRELRQAHDAIQKTIVNEYLERGDDV